ncbi:UNVERIFIED_CONTAM: hypothetical protein Sradi_2379500 [Sesamum radiatum]|uniref:Uncharacterized protein n=1 Tax=Sesamum radiatum TaxID=300843 RepID=A0AAW2T762_SESRA
MDKASSSQVASSASKQGANSPRRELTSSLTAGSQVLSSRGRWLTGRELARSLGARSLANLRPVRAGGG